MRLIKSADFTVSEIEMFNRYCQAKNRANLSSPSNSIFDIYGDHCWSSNILKFLLFDIDELMSDLTSVSNEKYRNILINISNLIAKLDGLLSADSGRDDTSIFIAISAIWINYCTSYNGEEYVYLLDYDTRGLLLNERVLQFSICSEYFNSVYAMPTGKLKRVYQFYFNNYGDLFRSPLDETLTDDLEIRLLMSLMRYTHFAYKGPMGKLTTLFRIT